MVTVEDSDGGALGETVLGPIKEPDGVGLIVNAIDELGRTIMAALVDEVVVLESVQEDC